MPGCGTAGRKSVLRDSPAECGTVGKYVSVGHYQIAADIITGSCENLFFYSTSALQMNSTYT